MNHKVLLADDSLTIQKVIKITLANQPYDITDCSSEEELFKKLPEVQPQIVFLDFNLAEKFTGYELTSRIKSICPSAKVLLLLGTFDTVDDDLLEKCKASDKIVKPFDSNKFIAICKHLIQEFEEEVAEEEASGALPSQEGLVSLDSAAEAEESLGQWQMDNSALKIEVAEEPGEDFLIQAAEENKVDALSREITDWGMSVPNVIDDQLPHDIRFDLPPVITEIKLLDKQVQEDDAERSVPGTPALAQEAKPLDTKYPEKSDLDYPTIEELESREQTATVPFPESEQSEKSSELVSLHILNEGPIELQLEGNYVEDVADVSSIEAQIRDEVEDNLWHADEFEDLKREVSTKIEEMQDQYAPVGKNAFDETLLRPIDDPQSIDWTETDEAAHKAASDHESQALAALVPQPPVPTSQELRLEMEEMVKEYVKQYIDQMFQKNVEKVSWEVIPDLAENLIRQELGRIANKIMSDQE